jgi:hypothetical protein
MHRNWQDDAVFGDASLQLRLDLAFKLDSSISIGRLVARLVGCRASCCKAWNLASVTDETVCRRRLHSRSLSLALKLC